MSNTRKTRPAVHVIRPVGPAQEMPRGDTQEARLRAADKPGQHLWTVMLAFHIADPAAVARGRRTFLDAETMIDSSPPGCYKCELPWSAELAARPCRGSVTELAD